MKLRAARNRVIVQREEAEAVSKGGIIIPDNAKQRPDKGRVLAVGEGRLLDDGRSAPFDVDVGDFVLFNKFCGAEVEFEGKEYLILTHDDVLCVVE